MKIPFSGFFRHKESREKEIPSDPSREESVLQLIHGRKDESKVFVRKTISHSHIAEYLESLKKKGADYVVFIEYFPRKRIGNISTLFASRDYLLDGLESTNDTEVMKGLHEDTMEESFRMKRVREFVVVSFEEIKDLKAQYMAKKEDFKKKYEKIFDEIDEKKKNVLEMQIKDIQVVLGRILAEKWKIENGVEIKFDDKDYTGGIEALKRQLFEALQWTEEELLKLKEMIEKSGI